MVTNFVFILIWQKKKKKHFWVENMWNLPKSKHQIELK
jgi:hypothetical protein